MVKWMGRYGDTEIWLIQACWYFLAGEGGGGVHGDDRQGNHQK